MPTKEIIRDNVRNDRIEAFEGSISSVKGIGQGMRVNLARGEINGYNLYLKANSRTNPTTKYVLIDSGANETTGHPFQVGANFKVKWDGTLNCNKVETLNNDGRADRAISISNNFYVTKSGGAGGSGVSFGGSFRGGFSGTGSGKFTGEFNGTHIGTGDFTSLKLGGTSLSKKTLRVVTGITTFKKYVSKAITSTAWLKFGSVLGNQVVVGWDSNHPERSGDFVTGMYMTLASTTLSYLGYGSASAVGTLTKTATT